MRCVPHICARHASMHLHVRLRHVACPWARVGRHVSESLEKNGNESDARIDELEQQVETGSSLLTNMVTLMQESEERIDSQQARIHALETILKQNGLGDFIP